VVFTGDMVAGFSLPSVPSRQPLVASV